MNKILEELDIMFEALACDTNPDTFDYWEEKRDKIASDIISYGKVKDIIEKFTLSEKSDYICRMFIYKIMEVVLNERS